MRPRLDAISSLWPGPYGVDFHAGVDAALVARHDAARVFDLDVVALLELEVLDHERHGAPARAVFRRDAPVVPAGADPIAAA